ncbi:MAG: DUF547 domain-containing protein [Candidatus Obscuribacterales bacterium]|nr:DUF547 domain-containing protein [Candidatus Obscuribacterales bacterium]
MPKIKKSLGIPVLLLVLLGLGILFACLSTFSSVPALIDSVCTKVSYPSSYEFKIFDSVLKKHVQSGLVDYQSLKSDQNLARAYQELKETNPQKLKGKLEQLSFWTNAYNLLVIKCINDHYPIKELGQSAATQKFVLGGKIYTIKQIKEDVLPELIDTSDWRAIFLFCSGSLSSPAIADHAYSASSISDELDSAMKKFVLSKANYAINIKDKTFSISKFYKWNSRFIDTKYPSPFDMVNDYLPRNLQVNFDNVERNYNLRFDFRINDLKLLKDFEKRQKELE